jgi:carbon storage regulator
MLILSRRPNESLQIGPDITVTVLGFHGNQVRLGITAPRAIVVDRVEVYQRKLRENTVDKSAPKTESKIDASRESAAQDHDVAA